MKNDNIPATKEANHTTIAISDNQQNARINTRPRYIQRRHSDTDINRFPLQESLLLKPSVAALAERRQQIRLINRAFQTSSAKNAEHERGMPAKAPEFAPIQTRQIVTHRDSTPSSIQISAIQDFSHLPILHTRYGSINQDNDPKKKKRT